MARASGNVLEPSALCDKSDDSLSLSGEDDIDEALEFVDDDELGNPENMRLFAEFKSRHAGFDDFATFVRDDKNIHEDQLKMIMESEKVTA